MRYSFNSFFLVVVTGVVLANCKSKTEGKLEYKLLKDFNYTPANITREVKLNYWLFREAKKR